MFRIYPLWCRPLMTSCQAWWKHKTDFSLRPVGSWGENVATHIWLSLMSATSIFWSTSVTVASDCSTSIFCLLKIQPSSDTLNPEPLATESSSLEIGSLARGKDKKGQPYFLVLKVFFCFASVQGAPQLGQSHPPGLHWSRTWSTCFLDAAFHWGQRVKWDNK